MPSCAVPAVLRLRAVSGVLSVSPPPSSGKLAGGSTSAGKTSLAERAVACVRV
jgi:hypothetical protein